MTRARAGLGFLLMAVACYDNPTLPEPLLIDLPLHKASIATDSPYTLAVDVVRKNGTVVSPRPPLDWESRAPAVVTVDSTGRIRGLKAGATWVVVRIRSQPAVSDSAEVIVIQPV